MKIGVALSGSDIGGVGAYSVLQELEQSGFEIGMISACGLPAVTSMLYAYGCSPERFHTIAEEFLKDESSVDLDLAVAGVAAAFPITEPKGRIPLALSAVNLKDGSVFTFTNDYRLHSQRLNTFDLWDLYDTLSSTVSTIENAGCYPFRGHNLCDYSVWHGSPVHPLHLVGLKRTVSVSFLPAEPRTPYELLVSQKIGETAQTSDLYLPISFGETSTDLDQSIKIATEALLGCKEDLYRNLLA